jgi:1-phosphofructokinase
VIVTVTLNPSLDRTIEIATLTRGAVIRAGAAHLGADGAVLVEGDAEEQVWFGESFVAEPRSTVGAGDAMLAGFLAAGARGQDALAEALAWAAAAVALPGSRMPHPHDIERDLVRLSPPDPNLPLRSGG